MSWRRERLEDGPRTLTPTAHILAQLEAAIGAEHVRTDEQSRTIYGTDALKRGHPADVVVFPGNTAEVAAVVRLCAEHRIPMVPRGGGTGYTGGSVPTRGGVVISLERMNRILEIDEANLIAIVEPNVITGDLQDAVEKVGLFYPPDPASLRQSVIGGNVAECAGGPRAFKYGTTKQYVLGLEAVLPTGEIIETGGKVAKNVVGYNLTHLLVGSEGTLAVIARIILRLVPKPPVQATLRGTFRTVDAAVAAVGEIIRERVVPAAIELVDGASLEAVARYLQVRSLAPEGTAAILLVEVDGVPASVAEEATRVERALRAGGATEILHARDAAERQELWRVRRELSMSLKMVAGLKFNHDVVVPKARIPALFALVESNQFRAPPPHPVLRARGRRQHPREHHGRPRRRRRNRARPPRRAAALRRRRRDGGVDQRRARHRVLQGALHFARALTRCDRPHEAGEGRLRSARADEPGKDLPVSTIC